MPGPGRVTHPPPGLPGGRPWGRMVRLTHGIVAALVLVNLLRDDTDFWHRALGYAAAGLVLLRLLWAAAAARRHATGLGLSLKATWGYQRARAPRQPGHDPLGLWMVWLLWSLIGLLALTGWMSRLDAWWGDEQLHDLHASLADVLGVAVCVHVVSIGLMSWHWRQNLPAAMLGLTPGARRHAPPDQH